MIEDVRLLRTAKNLIFEHIQLQGLDPRQFEWTTEGLSEIRSVLKHRTSDYYYAFGKNGDRCSPWHGELEIRMLADRPWSYRIQNVDRWLKELKEETEAPDLWGQLEEQKELFLLASSESYSNASFTRDEKSGLAAQLEHLRQQLIGVEEVSDRQREHIDVHFRYVISAMDRLGKKDWVNLAIGAVFNIWWRERSRQLLLSGYFKV
jgi:hypothetical protein